MRRAKLLDTGILSTDWLKIWIKSQFIYNIFFNLRNILLFSLFRILPQISIDLFQGYMTTIYLNLNSMFPTRKLFISCFNLSLPLGEYYFKFRSLIMTSWGPRNSDNFGTLFSPKVYGKIKKFSIFLIGLVNMHKY